MLKRIVCVVFIVFMLSHAVSNANPPIVEFAEDEKAYIKNAGTVTLGVDPDWPPFEWINEKGEHAGIAADLIQLVSERTGLKFNVVKTKSWDETLAMSKAGGCQGLSFLNETTNRDDWLLFSEPIFSDPNVFITREEHPYIADLDYFSNETMVLPSGTAMEELIRTRYPKIAIINVASEKEAIRMVSEKKADITMRSLVVAAYTIKKEGLFNLKIAGQLPEYTNKLRMAVNKDEPILRDILSKGIATITPEERWQIVNRHVSIQVQTETDYRLVWELCIGFLVLVCMGIAWSYKLKKYNKKLLRVAETDGLTGIYNRKKVDEELLKEFSKAIRSNKPLAIILIDIDNFKKVNDVWGHLMGDEIIKCVTQIAQGNIRKGDCIGRWGGEEFLILCPNTNEQEGYKVAERIRKEIEEYSFATQTTHTISAGIASLHDGDTIDSLLNRTDMLLYKAKKQGKNQIAFL